MSTILRLCLALSFCFSSPAMTAHAQEPTSKVRPSQLFTGDMLRLEPHLGLTGHGCVKMTFDESKDLDVKVHVWTTGKKSEPVIGASASPVKAGEVSISVREEVNRDGKMMYKLIVASPGGTFRSWADIPAEIRGTGSMSLPNEIAIKDGAALPVWALIGSKSGVLGFNSTENIEQVAKRVDWAMVLSISLKKAK